MIPRQLAARAWLTARAATAVAVLSACTLLTTRLPAQPIVESHRQEAKALFERGKQLFAAQDPTSACALFERSAKLAPNASAQTWVARCLVRANQLASALEAYRYAQQLNQTNSRTADRQLRLAEQLTAEIAALEPKVPKVQLSVVPAADEVLLDDVALPPSALSEKLMLNPGRHALVLRAKGYIEQRIVVDALESAALVERRVELQREALPAEPLPAPTPTAPAAPLPAASASPAPPPAQVVAADPTSHLAVNEAAAPSFRRTAGWLSSGAGLAGLGVSAYLGLRTLQLVGDADCDESYVCSNEGARQVQQAGRVQRAGLVVAGVSAAVLGLGIVLIATSAPRTEQRSARSLRIVVGSGRATLVGAW